jgi:hypothetical protein
MVLKKKIDSGCPESTDVLFYIGLLIYMLIAHVLLINRIMAIFSSTYRRIEVNTDKNHT